MRISDALNGVGRLFLDTHRKRLIDNTGETDYNPVPPRRSELVTMRAQFVGRGKPLPYPMDEE